ncbi:hypothetical protein SAMN02982929_06731 [Saccharopolyspora kobensis]|uniref:Uncharacterized protein n=2 Tax=Saccharopolyspora kobensis TaxID=146035 RepID=A0A1H6EHV7_9PSEU|nr:hypothetical protein SAMN02982929_06731 [Saccharopolyspora kobensis]SFC79777.1 hypothetical protein SAMN05216506_1011722 [Saccharopolyspora kobensis]
MVLHDMPPMRQALRELGRVLEVGSPFSLAIVHPVNRPREHLDDIEQLLEPRPDPAAVERAPELAAATRSPFFLHMRCRPAERR